MQLNKKKYEEMYLNPFVPRKKFFSSLRESDKARDSGCKRTLFRPFSIGSLLQSSITND